MVAEVVKNLGVVVCLDGEIINIDLWVPHLRVFLEVAPVLSTLQRRGKLLQLGVGPQIFIKRVLYDFEHLAALDIPLLHARIN
jgi:hypothetical protein